ncbi:MAG: long-chain-fatty-acid--CoA ligase [Deltaproteobacteria bacterium]|nr:long-chain-fatty-acid--CoA ligase [Deltaproteobacteria bacterium]
MNIPFILEKALNLYEHKEAVVCRDQRFTYGEFAKRVYALAHFLSSLGIRKRDRVAILHPNGHEFLESYFAAAQLGAILNPLNFRLSPSELSFILNDSDASVLISAPRYHEQVHALRSLETVLEKVVWTGGNTPPTGFEAFDYEEIVRSSPTDPPSVPDSTDDDVVHLYYTSGTTGRPKGVMLSHRNVCTHALSAIAELNLNDRDNWIHVAPLFHLADAWATFAITWVGGKHVVVTDFEPVEVLSVMERERVTITNMVPTMLNILVNTPEVSGFDFSGLRAILSGGAPIAPEVVRKIMATFKCDYVQTYGMTETSPYLTLSLLKENLVHLPEEDKFRFKAKTGRPFIGVLLRVVRDDGTDVNPDDREVGEIIVKGDIVTKGYWNRPEETANALRDGWLHTGDLAVIDREGYVNIVDRKKDMIITGGENVYSVEVENVLYMHPDVLEAAVIGVPDPKWGEAVTAVVVPKPNTQPSEADIIDFCKARIAHYKSPKSVVFISELPKTGSGKIFKKGIRETARGQVCS